MRIFELSTRITAISRAEGRSATAAAAYRACCAITCEREGRLHDYTRKRGLEVSRIVAPPGSPAWAMDRSALWNAAELRERNGTRGPNAGKFKLNAKTAREFMFAFPVELSPAGRLSVAETIARHLAATHGIVADFSIHQPGKDGDERNFHCHMLTTTRRMMPAGLGDKAREWDAFASGPSLSKQFRALLAATMNEALAAEGKAGAVHVEHRSFKERGGTRRPQRHLGPARTNAVRRDLRLGRQAWQATQIESQRNRHATERAALTSRQDRALQAKLRALADQERRAVAAIADVPRREAASGKPGVLLRLAQILGRQTPEVQSALNGAPPAALTREHQAEAGIAAVKAAIQTERAAYAAWQAQERQVLADRHAAEDRQLDAAAVHRKTHDRLAEQQHRRAPAHEREERQQELAQETTSLRPR